jgi:NADH:ubiquinone oxidoreductase subunit F (NADH-binding)
MWRVLERMARGEAKKSEIDMLLDVSHQVEGHKAGTFSPKEKALQIKMVAGACNHRELTLPPVRI